MNNNYKSPVFTDILLDGHHIFDKDGDRSEALTQLQKLQKLLARITALNLSAVEVTCMKAVCLFKPGRYYRSCLLISANC